MDFQLRLSTNQRVVISHDQAVHCFRHARSQRATSYKYNCHGTPLDVDLFSLVLSLELKTHLVAEHGALGRAGHAGDGEEVEEVGAAGIGLAVEKAAKRPEEPRGHPLRAQRLVAAQTLHDRLLHPYPRQTAATATQQS